MQDFIMNKAFRRKNLKHQFNQNPYLHVNKVKKIIIIRKQDIVFCVAFFLKVDWFMQRGQIPMFAGEINYAPYFYLQIRNHVGSINEFSSKKRLSLIDRVFVSAS